MQKILYIGKPETFRAAEMADELHRWSSIVFIKRRQSMNIDFSKIVNDKIKQMDESGIIQKVIEDGIEEVILKAISDQITGYETKRLIEQQVKSCIAEDLQDRIEKEVTGLVLKKEKPVKLSEIFERYREFMRDGYNGMDSDETFTLYCGQKRSSFVSNKYYCECAFSEDGDIEANVSYSDRLQNKEDYDILFETYDCSDTTATISQVLFRGEPAENMLQRRYLNSFECFILNLYLNKVKITMDMDNVDTDDNLYDCY